MQLLLLSMSAHMTKELGMAPGGEFRQAVKEVFIYIQFNSSICKVMKGHTWGTYPISSSH